VNLIDDDFDWREYDIAPEQHKVIKASSLADAVVDGFYAPTETKGDYLPWEKSQARLRLREHEVSLWAGINGHRKSMVTTQIAMTLLAQDSRCLIMSFEMRPKDTMMRACRMAAVSETPSTAYIRKLHEWTDNKLWLYDHYGSATTRQVLAVCRYAATELGISHIFIDSLMKCVAKTDDYNEQKIFVGDLCGAASAYPIHIHLIAHAKKGQSEVDKINKFDVKGASEITDQVDNVVLVQKNLNKEKAKKNGEAETEDFDQWLSVEKQRHGAYEGTMGLYFHSESLRFTERRGPPLPFGLH
jgi:twinkle protein